MPIPIISIVYIITLEGKERNIDKGKDEAVYAVEAQKHTWGGGGQDCGADRHGLSGKSLRS